MAIFKDKNITSDSLMAREFLVQPTMSFLEKEETPPNVLFIAEDWFPSGAVISMTRLIKALAKKGSKVDCLIVHGIKPEPEDFEGKGVISYDFLFDKPVESMGRSLMHQPNIRKDLLDGIDRHVQSGGFDTIHFMASYPEFTVLGLKHLAKLRKEGVLKAPIIITYHGGLSTELPEEYKATTKASLDFMQTHSDKVLSVSSSALSEIPHAIHLPFGIDTKYFDPKNPDIDKEGVRKRLGLPPAPIKIISNPARFTEIKNQLAFVDMMAELVKIREDVHGVLVGPQVDRGYVEKVRRRIDEVGLQGRITVLEQVSRGEIRNLQATSSVITAVSLSEGIPQVHQESLAMKIPVVATDVGGVAEIVKEGESGFLADAKDPQDFARKIARILGDDSLSRRMGETGRALIVSGYNMEKNLKRYIKISMELADRYKVRTV